MSSTITSTRSCGQLLQEVADAAHSLRDLPFFASFESDPELAERPEEILWAELGR